MHLVQHIGPIGFLSTQYMWAVFRWMFNQWGFALLFLGILIQISKLEWFLIWYPGIRLAWSILQKQVDVGSTWVKVLIPCLCKTKVVISFTYWQLGEGKIYWFTTATNNIVLVGFINSILLGGLQVDVHPIRICFVIIRNFNWDF